MLIPLTSPQTNQKYVHKLNTPSANHYDKTPHYPPRSGHIVLRALACCVPFAWQSNKVMLFYFTQNPVSEIQFGTGGQILATVPPPPREASVILLRCTLEHESTTPRPSIVLRVKLKVLPVAHIWDTLPSLSLGQLLLIFLVFFTGRLSLLP